MNYAFVDQTETTSAAFDPTVFELPDLIARSQGPALTPPAAEPALTALEQQAAREAARARQLPGAANQQVSQNLKQQLQVNASDTRAEQLKPWILKLKASHPEPEALRVLVMTCLENLQSCYASEHVPKDLTTMSLLHPLLKCQAYKWDALKTSGPVAAPPQEAGYLQKLRQLKCGLGLVERAALMQLILALNHHLPVLSGPEVTPEVTPEVRPEAAPAAAPVPAPVAASMTQPSPAAAPAESSEPAEAFDPIQASRLSLQLRAKLQRTHSPTEKAEIQAQLQSIDRQQQGFFKARQTQALDKQIQDFTADLARFGQPGYSVRSFESWRKLRLSGLQNMARLFSQGTKDPVAISLFESAQSQLARLGLADAPDWIAAEQRRIASTLTPELKPWLEALQAMLQGVLGLMQRLEVQMQAAEHQRRLEALEQSRGEWQARLDRLKSLEADYLATSDFGTRQSLLQAYAELMAALPSVPEVKS